MPRFALPCLALLALSAPTLAQSPLGFMNRTETSFTSRGSNATANAGNPTYVFLRIDKESYAGWGVDPANPGLREIVGMTGVLQDQIGNTPETYDLVVHTEDPANPNYPLTVAPLTTIAGLPTPPSAATGPAVVPFTATFGTPVLAPATGDVFLGVCLPQPLSGVWPADGLSCHALYYVMQGMADHDIPGGSHPVGQPEEGNGMWYIAPPASTIGVQYTTTPRQWKLEPLVNGAAGVAGAITNQTSAPLSNVAPGTSSMASGLHPDVTNPPFNVGRIDDIAHRWFMTGMPNNSGVFFFATFQPFGPEFPLTAFLPGDGVVCLDTNTAAYVGFATTANGEAFFQWQITPAARMFIGGVGITQQAVALDPVTLYAYSGPCTRQIL